jgi:hypothetical protein
MERRFDLPRAAESPKPVELAAPEIGDDVHILGLMGSEDQWSMEFCPRAVPLLQPSRNPGKDLPAGLRPPDVASPFGLSLWIRKVLTTLIRKPV